MRRVHFALLAHCELPTWKEILSGDRLSRPDEQTEIDDEISDQMKEDAGNRRDVAIIPQIPSGFGQNRGTLFFLRRTGHM